MSNHKNLISNIIMIYYKLMFMRISRICRRLEVLFTYTQYYYNIFEKKRQVSGESCRKLNGDVIKSYEFQG